MTNLIKIISLIGFLMFMIVGLGTTHATEKTIVLSGTLGTKESMHGRWLSLIYEEAFTRMGYNFVYEGFPAKRSSRMSDSGKTDGEIHRVYSYGKVHPNVIRVDEPHFHIRFSAYSNDNAIRLDGWESLQGKNLRVGYRIGVKMTESQLPRVVKEVNLRPVSELTMGLYKLATGQVDIFIDVEKNIEDTIQRSDRLLRAGIVKVGTMVSISTHAYLHKKHNDLVPILAEKLRNMKAEGLIVKFREIAR